MSGSIKKIIKKIPFVGSYVKKVQTEKKEEEQKQKLEKKRLELQKEQERIKVWLKSEKQNAPDKNSRKISVIVHHHTGEEQLQKLKENFKEAAAGLEFEVFTADIESKQNTSFAEFCNEAARKATGEYLFFLDESVRLASECLNAMLLAAEQNEKAGAVGARILYPESEKAISKFAAVKSCGIAFHKKKRNKTWYWQPYDLLAGEETLEVDLQPSVQKAVRVDVMLVLRERFLEVRGFDPAYQSIHVKKDEFSETDLCLKLSKAGYQNLLAPAALAFQSAEEKSKPDQAEKDRRLYNLYVYQGKWQSCLTRMFSEEEDKPIVPDSKKIDICAPMPDDENKKFWGDYHYALAMKKELEKQIKEEGKEKIQFFLGARRNSGEKEYYWVDEDNEFTGDRLDNNDEQWCKDVWLKGEPSYYDSSVKKDEDRLNIFYYSQEDKWVFNDVPNDILDAVSQQNWLVPSVASQSRPRPSPLASDRLSWSCIRQNTQKSWLRKWRRAEQKLTS